ncbi:hypothetical protein CDCA_CDCA17G4358 [Cyanidium caldarium]|uniref:Uncharacterized protein n=1 Tax=Cyanidium caldarium TaxID=2771 RepID=A0AAV9J167_CYACA|nr:hypothetical protein CDCA_CDCA17G4358 [Cyanidium caldarium]|eukprot:ctg_467.g124
MQPVGFAVTPWSDVRGRPRRIGVSPRTGSQPPRRRRRRRFVGPARRPRCTASYSPVPSDEAIEMEVRKARQLLDESRARVAAVGVTPETLEATTAASAAAEEDQGLNEVKVVLKMQHELGGDFKRIFDSSNSVIGEVF